MSEQKIKSWTCFRCDETFTDHEEARLHFGDTMAAQPGCLIKLDAEERGILYALRRFESERARYHEEDSGLHRAIYAMQSEHRIALRHEEEKGYERGLVDSAPYFRAEHEKLQTVIDTAIALAIRHGGHDGVHHKAWVIDQVLRILAGNDYQRIITESLVGADGPSMSKYDDEGDPTWNTRAPDPQVAQLQADVKMLRDALEEMDQNCLTDTELIAVLAKTAQKVTP